MVGQQLLAAPRRLQRQTHRRQGREMCTAGTRRGGSAPGLAPGPSGALADSSRATSALIRAANASVPPTAANRSSTRARVGPAHSGPASPAGAPPCGPLPCRGPPGGGAEAHSGSRRPTGTAARAAGRDTPTGSGEPSASSAAKRRAASARQMRSTTSSGYAAQSTGVHSGAAPCAAGTGGRTPRKIRAASSETAPSVLPGSFSRSQAGRSPSREVKPAASRSRRDSSVSAETTPASSRVGHRPSRQAGSATRVSSRSQPA